jgi:hypothetical protein
VYFRRYAFVADSSLACSWRMDAVSKVDEFKLACAATCSLALRS